MRTIILFVITTLLFTKVIAQKKTDNFGIKSVKLYCVEWNIKSNIAFTIENFKERYKYYFENKGNNLDIMFFDYQDCIEKLSKQEIIQTDSAGYNMIRTYIELKFNKNQKLELYFDVNGNYYFQNKWFKRNDCLYYNLFKYFSNILTQSSIIEKNKTKCQDAIWHDN